MAEHFSIRPLTVGAEIVDLTSDPGDPAVRDDLFAAWLEYGLLLFRDVDSIERHIALSRCFGELEIHPLPSVRAPENDLFMVVGDEISRPYVYDDAEIKVGTIPWHRDTAYTPNISTGALLRILVTPDVDGETMFADTARAYDDLPDDVKARLAGLEYRATLRRSPMEQTGPGAIWRTVRPLTDEEWAKAGLSGRAADGGRRGASPPSVVHPAVVVHPESGRTCLFLSPKEFDFFLGMEPVDSDELFAYLCDHMLQGRYVYKHRWAVDDVVGWDNRRFLHAAVGSRIGDRRRGLRTTLAGAFGVGRLVEAAASGAGN
ncbi:TauD/TfdA dioxygenase family protein [Pseudofrankia saprophytica]|uniref:TauD/TfdA dioxygenase family protein n=1 Tax=Pseudofrankia saprophytica TaxID=298655 RepID=UPI000234B7A3|nr:TauD/TfdA family dioxygenase [Pseudofrankia saprophytica]